MQHKEDPTCLIATRQAQIHERLLLPKEETGYFDGPMTLYTRKSVWPFIFIFIVLFLLPLPDRETRLSGDLQAPSCAYLIRIPIYTVRVDSDWRKVVPTEFERKAHHTERCKIHCQWFYCKLDRVMEHETLVLDPLHVTGTSCRLDPVL